VAGARDFDRLTVRSFGIPAFEIGVDGSVCCRYQHPARFASLARCGGTGHSSTRIIEWLIFLPPEPGVVPQQFIIKGETR